MLKNILGELDAPAGDASTSSAGVSVAPRPMRSIRKQATESEIEMKNYMEKFGKKVMVLKKSDAGDVSKLCHRLKHFVKFSP